MSDRPGTQTKTALLEVQGVRHVYGEGETAHVAIDQLDFRVNQGEFVSIVGPSGAGKSTLLRVLSGLIKPTQGTITLQGANVVGVPAGMAMVFQDYSRSLLPWLTVEKNVAFPLNRLPATERVARVKDGLESVGLAGHGDRYPWQLSGGMQQRVAIARALAYQPSLLLMDEPFASVDAQTRQELEDLVLKISADHHMTVLFVTHDIDESVYLSDRVLVLSRAPARLLADVTVDIPGPRDQITTRETETFVHLRADVARMIRSGEAINTTDRT